MKDKIKALETQARRLEPGPNEREAWTRQVTAYTERFLQSLPTTPTYVADDGASMQLDPDIEETPAALDALIDELERAVDTPGINPASGGHLGYIPGGGLYPSALGDFLADVSNRYAGVAFASPGAVRLEKTLVDWIVRLVGYPVGAGGDLTSGGSIANLSALVTARDAQDIKAREIPQSTIYLTGQVHHCVDKALRMAGLDECPRRMVPMDGRYRMDPQVLERMIDTDNKAGLRPWLVVASAGTTDTGAIDPLSAISEICRRHKIWFHLDAAYGGFFRLCEEGRAVLGGMEEADSVVMDPHKGLFLPYGSGALLVRDVHQLARAHSYEANYMQDARAAAADYSPADLSAELSRPFRGLRLWLPIKLLGLGAFRAALAEKIWLARYFHQRLGAVAGFEVGPEPDLSVVTYRYRPTRGDVDEFNQRLLRAVLDDGKVFISSTRLDGAFTLRLAVLHFRTHLDTIDYLLDLLQSSARRLEAE
ncbi:MAG: pyridoxal-dependent decarboxylase [Xanthomonadales bacterium]|nr:pyridoxal-dependent decarboxylase [Xanthomonadales bacterium]